VWRRWACRVIRFDEIEAVERSVDLIQESTNGRMSPPLFVVTMFLGDGKRIRLVRSMNEDVVETFSKRLSIASGVPVRDGPARRKFWW
jgi:hypothetical protein